LTREKKIWSFYILPLGCMGCMGGAGGSACQWLQAARELVLENPRKPADWTSHGIQWHTILISTKLSSKKRISTFTKVAALT